jgi:hypothetical protein
MALTYLRHRGGTAPRKLLQILCLVAAASCCAARAAPPVSEYQVKAAYLFNFGQFVEWPERAYDSPAAPFAICVLGGDPFGKVLDDAVAGESHGTHPLVVKRFANASDVSGCHILFIGRSEESRLDETLKALKGRSVLTVTDIPGAESRGAVIALVNENNHIRMRINVASAKAGDLVISSKLLRPAEVVGQDGG